MALNPYNNHHNPWGFPMFPGFDDLFAPTSRETFDLMPIFPNIERGADSVLLRSSPGYEIQETDTTYNIAVDVPGVKASDMKVDLENNGRVLHITGGRKIVKENEQSEVKFEKRFTIGSNVDYKKMSASLENGVLMLTAPKKEKEETKAFNVPITEGPARLES